MKKLFNIIFWIFSISAIFAYAYIKGYIFANFEQVTPQQAVAMLKNDSNITLLDVRTPGEYKEGHLAGAILIPLSTLDKNLNRLEAFKQKKILVYCRSGGRSVMASRILESNGFLPINVKEGMNGLKNRGVKIDR